MMLEEAQVADLRKWENDIRKRVIALTGHLRELNEQNSKQLEEKIAPTVVNEADAPILNTASDWETSFMVTALKGLQGNVDRMQQEMLEFKHPDVTSEMKELIEKIEDAKNRHFELKQNYLSLKEELDRAKADIIIEKEEIRRYIRANMLIER